MTNYERIKAMSIEEMAEFIDYCENVPCQCCNYTGNLCGEVIDAEMCKNEISEWLNSEVEE